MIRVKATDDGDYLMISSISGNHNHALNKESYDHLPSVRKLDADDRKMAEQMLAMKVDKKVVQNHLIQKTQKQVLLYDLHNIAAAYNKSKGDCDSLPKEMKKKGNILPKEMKKEGNGLPKEMKKDVDQHKRSGPSTRTTDGMVALSWNNHSATFCHMLSAFRQKDKYTDAMLACEGKFYPVHKLVLSTCSQYFEEMFDHTLGKHPIVLLQDVKCDEIEALLNFMYVGIVSVAQKDLTRFFKVAELLQIKGLAVAGEVQRDKNTLSSSNNRNAKRSPQSREFVDSTDGRWSPHPKRRKQDDTSSPSPMLSSHSKDSEERLDYRTSDDRSRIELHLEQVRGSESETESLHHKGSTTSNSVPEESNMLSGVKLQEQSATRNPSMDISENMIYIKEEVWEDPAIVIKEEVWEDPELSHNNSIDPSFTYSIASDSADPDSHDGVHEEHTGTSKEFSYPGVPVQGSQELAETVVEALAGPSGMQEWHSHS
ncbi:protein jim lovell isoform X2 [Penaeus vannamei]